MGRKLEPLPVGASIWRFTVLSLPIREGKYLQVQVRCECGVVKVLEQGNLRSGRVTSCGCYGKAASKERFTTHGMRGTPLYAVWNSMIQRCHNPGSQAYKYYGAKGITVSEEWRKFENFYADMGDKPYLEATLERRDAKLGYCKSNVIWATRLEQANNKGNNVLFDYKGEKLSLRELAEKTGVNKGTLSTRIYTYGLSAEEAADLPVMTPSESGRLAGNPVFIKHGHRIDGELLYPKETK